MSLSSCVSLAHPFADLSDRLDRVSFFRSSTSHHLTPPLSNGVHTRFLSPSQSRQSLQPPLISKRSSQTLLPRSLSVIVMPMSLRGYNAPRSTLCSPRVYISMAVTVFYSSCRARLSSNISSQHKVSTRIILPLLPLPSFLICFLAWLTTPTSYFSAAASPGSFVATASYGDNVSGFESQSK